MGHDDERLSRYLRIVWDESPETITHAANLGDFTVRLGYKLKLAGFAWRELSDIGKLMTVAEKLGVLRREGSSFARWRPLDGWGLEP